jgi:hypothetical protein
MYGKFADLAALDERVNLGHINKRVHLSDPDIFIYNYSPVCQYANAWDEHTMQARGLVVNSQGKILVRPMKKFFNLEQHVNEILPWDKPFEVTTKMDGSMIAHCNGITITRGSFESIQSKWGQELLNEYNAHLDSTITYIFELIHPENRIVIDYGKERKLVLLAMIETATGRELPLDYNLGIEVVQFHSFNNIEDGKELYNLAKPNEEGFVVKFFDNTRVKVKFAEYVRLHRIVTGVSTKSIWDYLRNGQSFAEMLEMVPDEFNDFVKKTIAELETNYAKIEKEGLELYDAVKSMSSRKEQALYINAQKSRTSFIAFKLLDGKSYSDGIWKLVEPEFRQPFSSRENI